MNPINDGGPAFPHGPLGDSIHGEDGLVRHQFPAGCGMSLRDWFAGREKLTDWLSTDSGVNREICEALAGPRPSTGWACKTPEEWVAMLQWEATWQARVKYIRADAMLAAREKGNA